MVKKFIFICMFIMLVILSHSYYLYTQSSGLYDANTHTSAVKKFWYNQKKDFIEGKKLALPFSVEITSFDYMIGDFAFEGGTYYFKTTLVINERILHVDSAVKAFDGIWEVDVRETFMGAHLATLDYIINDYLSYQNTLNTYLKEDYIWGMGEKYNQGNEEYLRDLLSSRLKQLENRTIELYKETSN